MDAIAQARGLLKNEFVPIALAAAVVLLLGKR